MNPRFCPKCGKQETNLVNNLCKSCSSKENPLLIEFKKTKTTICSSCNSYLYKNKWYKSLDEDLRNNIKKIIIVILRKKLTLNPEANITKLNIFPLIPEKFHLKKGNLLNFDIRLELKGKIFTLKKEESYIIPYQIEFSICNLCKKRTSGYYEAILQIRPKSKELLNFIKNDIAKKKNVFITKEEHLKYGYNLYLTSQNYAKQILALLKTKFDIETKSSYTLFGKKDGKDVYRTTILIKLNIF